jgi:hypothetical protein
LLKIVIKLPLNNVNIRKWGELSEWNLNELKLESKICPWKLLWSIYLYPLPL